MLPVPVPVALHLNLLLVELLKLELLTAGAPRHLKFVRHASLTRRNNNEKIIVF
jgi:hypothetical protein